MCQIRRRPSMCSIILTDAIGKSERRCSQCGAHAPLLHSLFQDCRYEGHNTAPTVKPFALKSL